MVLLYIQFGAFFMLKGAKQLHTAQHQNMIVAIETILRSEGVVCPVRLSKHFYEGPRGCP